jgi:dolichol-phosphate mannosyltransferase
MPRATSTDAWFAAGSAGILSVVVPAHNEAETLGETVAMLVTSLETAHIAHEIVVVNDNGTDGSADVLAALAARYATLRVIDNPPPNGFGLAVRAGLDACRGHTIAIVMADGSDDPADLVKCYNKLNEGYDCVFGSRFIIGSRVIDYPTHKLIINRLANTFIRLLFRQRFNDFTNAFKIYRREVIAGVQPLLSHHFNLTVELPLKALIRGYNFAIVPISWQNRKHGVSKLRIREMGSRYLFIVLYCFLEERLSRGDYKRLTRQLAGEDRPSDLSGHDQGAIGVRAGLPAAERRTRS